MNLDADPKILHLAANSPVAYPTGEQESGTGMRGKATLVTEKPPAQHHIGERDFES